MKLRYITCSDPREHNSVKDIIKLAQMPHAEIAVQCHPSKMSDGMPRNVWFNSLLHEIIQMRHKNIAIHINAEWAYDICARGVIPDIILDWMKIEKLPKKPLVQRVQLNMSKDTADNIDINALRSVLYDFRNTEFIFQYNDKTKDAIEKLHKTGANFSLLFDASGGNGISPENWQKPVYENHPMGYSGGLSPDNIVGNLRKIEKVVGDNEIWCDAEGKLKSQNLFEEKALFDTNLARAYITRANKWQKQH